jgi:hypothetical protein
VYENRVLRRILGTEREEVTGDWRRLHNEELHDFYCSPNIVRVVKSRTVRKAETGGDEKYLQNCGRKTRRKETSWKT